MYNTIIQTHKIKAESRKQIKVRGKAEPVAIYHVHDIEQPNAHVVDNLIDDILSKPYSRTDSKPVTPLEQPIIVDQTAHGKIH